MLTSHRSVRGRFARAASWLAAGLVLLTLGAGTAGAAPGDRSVDGVWTEIPAVANAAPPAFLASGAPTRVLALDDPRLSAILDAAPREFLPGARAAAPTLTLPMPAGGYARFAVLESPILAGKLADERPDILTFIAQGIDDPTATARLDHTPGGFHAMIRTTEGTIYIDPIERGGTVYRAFSTANRLAPAIPFVCEVGGGTVGGDDSLTQPGDEMPGAGAPGGLPTLGGNVGLRTYRLAVVVSGEYHNFFGSVAEAEEAITTTMNRVTGIYETEVAVRFNVTSTIIYTNPATDPFADPNNISGAQLDRVDSLLDADVGVANYDIGHYMSAGGTGGRAGPGPCSGSKGRGGTARGTPEGDAFDVDYVAHEIGHQMGANHTFNGTTTNCGGGNRASGAAYEPGSGSTIMAYAGICGAENVQPNSDAYFHLKSLFEILGLKAGSGAACGTLTDTGNEPPTAGAGGDWTVPRDTPFTLTGSGGDPDGNALTYCWEEYDLGDPTPPGNPANSPTFRSRTPSTSSSRTFPRMSDIFANSVSPWERLPTADRVMNMRLTTRDNVAGGGGTASDDMNLTIAGAPFRVTSPNGGESLVAGCPTTVTWTVGGGSIAANVNILLTTNDGGSYVTLLAGTTNDGSAEVVLPCDSNSSNARLRIEGVGQVFFDISDGDFTIVAAGPTIVAMSSTDQVVDGSCDAVVPFSVTFRDDCSLPALNTNVIVSLDTGTATLGTPTVIRTQVSPTEVRVDVSVPVTQLSTCPVTIEAFFSATDNCGLLGEQSLLATVSDTQDPTASVVAVGGDVDATCAYLMPFSGYVEDNCTVDADDVTVTITNPGGNATLGVPTIVKVQTNAGRVDVTGTVLVSDLTSCPAVVRVVLAGVDGCGNDVEVSDEAEVYDRIPPTIDVVLNRTYLWPPNHSLAAISADVTIADNCPNPTFVLTSVTSNEPENDLGDGNFLPDIVGAATGTADTEFQLRSERMGTRTGRIYTIVYTASDHCGNSTSKSVEVRVAHDRSATMVTWADPDAATTPPADGGAPALSGDRGVFAMIVRSMEAGDGIEEGVVIGGPTAGAGAIAGAAFDARTAIRGEALVGNVGGVIAPLKIDQDDVDGDGFTDVIFYFDSEAMSALAEAVTTETGPVGFHLGTTLGESFWIENLFSMGDPMAGLRRGGAARSTAAAPGAPALAAAPAKTAFLGARPTPFRGATSLAYDLARESAVTIEVWNVRGARVRALASGVMPAGRHVEAWDGRDDRGRSLPAGLYWVRFVGDGVTRTAKAVLVD